MLDRPEFEKKQIVKKPEDNPNRKSRERAIVMTARKKEATGHYKTK